MTQLNVEYDEVRIVDFLSDGDYLKYDISQNLYKHLTTLGISTTIMRCGLKKDFVLIMQELITQASAGKHFCVHIVSHGNKSGLGIGSSGDFVSWNEFGSFFEKVNAAMNNTMILNMTSCLGLNGIRIADGKSEKFPFFGLIGYSVELGIDRCKEINRLFYDKLIDGKTIDLLVEEIKTELGDSNLFCISTEGYRTIIEKTKKN